MVRRLGDAVLGQDIEARFLEGRPNPAALPAMADASLLGLTLPPRYGGLGRDYHALATACEELARVDLAYQIGLTVHLALTAMTVLQWGTETQKAAWLPALARGERIATFGLTAFLVLRETPGVATTVLGGKLGARAGDTGSVVCDRARVPAANVLGEPGEGFPVALSALAAGLFTVGAGALGVATECLALTVSFLQDLDRRGLRAGREQWVQARVAAMVAGEARSRLLLRRAAELKNRGLPSQRATSLAKWVAAEAANDAAEAALEVHQAFVPGPHPTVERHLRNVKGAVIYGGTAEVHQTMQAAYALGDRTERPFRRPPPTAADLAGLD